MIEYSANGLSCSYPKNLKRKGDLPLFALINPKTKRDFSATLEPKDWGFKRATSVRFVFAGEAARQQDPRIEILRFGDYSKFPGAKELLVKRPYDIPHRDTIFRYVWTVLIPVGKRIINAGTVEDNLADIDQLWEPIVASMKFDPASFVDDDSSLHIKPKIKRQDWTKKPILANANHFKYSKYPEFGFWAFYDSTIEFKPDLVSDEDMTRKIAKSNHQVALYPNDADNLLVDCYLNADPPDSAKPTWEHVVEGIIAIDSGKLYINTQGIPDVEVVMKSGNYKFQVYFGVTHPRTGSQRCQIYFWPTEEPETNEVTVIKQRPEAS